MQVTLPSGHTAEIRDVMLRGDRRAAKRAAKIVVNMEGVRTMDLSFEDDVIGAVLKSMMVSWSIPQTLPSAAANDEIAQHILDALPDDDYQALAEAVRPFVDRILLPAGRDREDPKRLSTGTGTTSSAGEQNGPATQSS